MDTSKLTIEHVQKHQPWTVPYSEAFRKAMDSAPHIIGSHVALHVMKTAGKIAAVFEALDHGPGKEISPDITEVQHEVIANMSADLLTAALRFANLYKFNLASKLAERVQETNGVTWPDIERAGGGRS